MSVANDTAAAVAADPVAKLCGLRNVPQRKVGALADRDRASIVAAQCARRMARDPGKGFGRRQAESVHARLSISGSEVAGEVPGLQSDAMAIGTPCARSAAIGGSCVSRNA